MSSKKKNDTFWKEFQRYHIWKIPPYIVSFTVVGIWIIVYSILLKNQAIRMDSILPILEAHRPDILLFFGALTAGLGALTFLVASSLTMRYINSITESSDLSELLERIKKKLGIERNVNIRIYAAAGTGTVSIRNVFSSTMIVSPDAQSAILQNPEKGEVIIASELSDIQNSRPWFAVAGCASICAYAEMHLIPETFLSDLIDLYGWLPLLTEFVPMIFMFLGMILLFSSSSDHMKSKMMVINAYQILPSIARAIVFNGLELSDEEIQLQTKSGSSFGRTGVEDKWGNVCLITCIGSIAAAIFFASLVNPIVLTTDLPGSLVSSVTLLASLLSFVIIFFLVALRYNVIDDSRPSPFYELENSSRNQDE